MKLNKNQHITRDGVIKKNPRRSPKFYTYLWVKNKGIFYRGTAGGKGIGVSFMGVGTYLTWDKGMAKAFAKMSSEQTGGIPEVQKYNLSKSLRLADWESKEVWEIRKGLGTEKPWDKIEDQIFARLLTEQIKEKGYEGVISDDKAFGLLVFDEKNLERL